MTREEIIEAVRESGVDLGDRDGLFIDDCLVTWQQQLEEGRRPWPVRAFAVIAERREASRAGDESLAEKLDDELWSLLNPGETQVKLDRDRLRRGMAKLK